jgi:hypothetical protein
MMPPHRGIREQHHGIERALSTEPADERCERLAEHMAIAEELAAKIDE